MTDQEPSEHDGARLGEALDRILDDLFEGRPADIGSADGVTDAASGAELVRAHELARRAAGAHAPPLPRFDDYEIEREVGRGGMGAVYVARRHGLEQRVALKVLPPAIALSARSRRRFLEEARTLQQLDDEHIVRIHRILDQDQVLAFEMEWIDGPSLRQVLDALRSLARPPTLADLAELLGLPEPRPLAKDLPGYFVRVAAEIAGALATVHASGLVHRDVKPSNILIRSDGRALLSDFGLVRDPDSSGTRTVGFVGTPVYASPEQRRAAEDPESVVDGRSDVYSLGVTLHECLTGRPPARRTDADGIARHPTRIDHTVPRRLGDVVRQAIAPDPRRRYTSALAFEDDLRRFLAGEAVTARPPALLERGKEVAHRHRRPLAGLALGALAVAAAVSWPGGANAGPAAVRTSSFEIPRAAAVYSIHGRQIDFTPDGLRAVHRLPGGGLALWDHETSASRRIEIGTTQPWSFHSPRWSPDGRRVALLGALHPKVWGVFLLEPGSGELTPLRLVEGDHRLQPHDLCWTPDGKAVTIVTREWALHDLDEDGHDTRWPVTTTRYRWTLGGYSADGRWLVCSAVAAGQQPTESDLYVVPTGGGRPRRITTLPGQERAPLFDPDGRTIWFVHALETGSDVYRIGFDTGTGRPVGEPERVTHAMGRQLQDLAFADDGDLIYRVARRHAQISVGDDGSLENGRIVAAGEIPVLSGDGRTLYYVASEPRRSGLFALDLRDGGAPVRIARRIANSSAQGVPPFAVCGEHAIYCAMEDDAFGIFEAVPGEPPRRLAETSGPVEPRCSPDGTRVAFIDDRTLFLVDRATGRRRELAPGIRRWEEWTVRWSPRGDALVAVSCPTSDESPETNDVVLVTLPTGEVRSLTPAASPVYMESVDWHPSGTFLTCVAYADSGEELRTIHLDGRPPELMWREEGHFPWTGAWSPSGREYVFLCSGKCSGGMQTHIFDLDRRSMQVDPTRMTAPPSWDAAGDRVAWTTIHVTWHFERLHDVR